MKTKHIILRSFLPRTRDAFLGDHQTFPMAAAMGHQPFPRAAVMENMAPAAAVEVDELDRRDVIKLTRDASTVAIAPAMPMKLIEPRAGKGGAAALASNTTWGVKAVGAETSPFTGKGITVAVLDTGIAENHPAFPPGQVKFLKMNFTNDSDHDEHGHGTHCAGTIFGRDVEGKRIGVARGVERALIGKVLGESGGSSDQIVRAIQWAVDNGANVISMSLGIDFPGYVNYLVEDKNMPVAMATSRGLEAYRQNVQLFERLASLIRAQGAFGQAAILVAAAGNESARDEDADFEIAVSPPAVAEGFISVAALGTEDNGLFVAPFSNTFANISAPGMNVLSAAHSGGLVSWDGTSMATPHVAGVAALWAEKIMQTRPLNGLEWTARLIASASTAGFNAGFDPFDVGAGLVQAPQP